MDDQLRYNIDTRHGIFANVFDEINFTFINRQVQTMLAM